MSKSTSLKNWLTTTDHKKIGLGYFFFSTLFFIIGGIEALVIRLQLMQADSHWVSPESFNVLFTLHGTTMIFLFAMPLFTGFANYFIPLMIGANDMVFPKLNALSFWLFPFAGIIIYFSFFTNSAPDAGWFSYAPLSTRQYSLSPGISFWALGLLLSGVSSIGGAINILTTVICSRTEGMSPGRLPLFVWMMSATAVLTILALPSLSSALIWLLMDRLLFIPMYSWSKGSSTLLWQHLFWIFGHPEVYILALPAFGMISEIIPVFSRRAIYGYNFIVGSTIAITLLSYGVWAHHMFATGLGSSVDIFFAVGSLLIGIPTGVKVFNWTATLYGGRIYYKTAMLFALAFLFQFVIGGMTGIMFATVPVDWQLTDTYFVVAHIHYVLFGGSMYAVFAAIYYWYPKMTGRCLDEPLGRWHFWLMLLGFNMTFFVQHFLGLMGMPRRVYTYSALRPGWGEVNMISTLGSFLLAFSFLFFLWNLFTSYKNGKKAGNNPWNGFTLEWSVPSPPLAHDNFKVAPKVEGPRPQWDAENPGHKDSLFINSMEDKGRRLSPLKVSMMTLIASEATFFLTLLGSAFILKNTASQNFLQAHLNLQNSTIATLILVFTSFSFKKAYDGLVVGNKKLFLSFFLTSQGLALTFIFNQIIEWKELLSTNHNPRSDLYYSSFLAITGFHGLHVIVGLIAFSIISFIIFRKKGSNTILFEPVLYYWHFVDIVWLFVFSFFYLGRYF